MRSTPTARRGAFRVVLVSVLALSVGDARASPEDEPNWAKPIKVPAAIYPSRVWEYRHGDHHDYLDGHFIATCLNQVACLGHQFKGAHIVEPSYRLTATWSSTARTLRNPSRICASSVGRIARSHR